MDKIENMFAGSPEATHIIAPIDENYPDEIKEMFIDGKNPDRVHKGYRKYPSDWRAQYDMLLMDGKTCADCIHSENCSSLFGGKDTNKRCQFHPNKFRNK